MLFNKKQLKNDIKVSIMINKLKNPYNLTYLNIKKHAQNNLIQEETFFKKNFFTKSWNLIKPVNQHLKSHVSSFIYNKTFKNREDLLLYLKTLKKKEQYQIIDINLNKINFKNFKSFKNLFIQPLNIIAKLNYLLNYNIYSIYKLINKTINKE